jgi:hypothetical protein
VRETVDMLTHAYRRYRNDHHLSPEQGEAVVQAGNSPNRAAVSAI